MAVSFQHQQLHRESREIRLLKLLPRNQWLNDLLPTCSMFHASIDQCPSYVALSYVWGDPCDQRVISVNGCAFKVTKNLFEALIGIVGAETMVVWIDAICINQTDDEEKGWQVASMGDIYRNTSEVLAWLGPSADNSDKVLDHMNVLGSIAEACYIPTNASTHMQVWKDILGTWPNKWNASEFASSIKAELIHVRGLEILLYAVSGLKHHKHLIDPNDLKRLFQRPWWQRVWVLQEITVPEKAQFVCGTRRISRHRFCAASDVYHGLGNALFSSPQLQRSISSYPVKVSGVLPPNAHLMLSMSKLYQRKRVGLVEIIRATNPEIARDAAIVNLHRLLSTDPRDKIFALLNLANDKEELRKWGVFPDYTKTKEETYTCAVIAMLKQGHVSILSQACGVKRPGGLPSWVPDWSKSVSNTLQVIQSYWNLEPRFTACGSKQRRDIKFKYEKKRMLVMGTICDEVLRPGFVSRQPDLFGSASPLMWLQEVEKLTHLIKGSKSNYEVRLQTAARAAHASMTTNTNGLPRRPPMFPETVNVLKMLTPIGNDGCSLSEIQQILLQRLSKSGDDRSSADLQHMLRDLMRISKGRSPLVTSRGRLGIGSMEVKKGDVIALISGAETPFILRPTGERFMVVSEAYVDGIMDGEAAEDSQWGMLELV